MGVKLLWTGLTISMALQGFIPSGATVGAVVMVIGLVLMWMDR